MLCIFVFCSLCVCLCVCLLHILPCAVILLLPYMEKTHICAVITSKHVYVQVVELAAGKGDLALMVAHSFPQLQVIPSTPAPHRTRKYIDPTQRINLCSTFSSPESGYKHGVCEEPV